MTNPEDALEKALYPEMELFIKENYPNPNRVGCPDHSFREKAVINTSNPSSEERVFFLEHVPKCWPCYCEVKRLKQSAGESS